MPWDGFATWGDVATDSLIHGVEFGAALGGLALLIAFGVSKLAELYQRLI